jgi:hypothetical protein
VVFFLVGLRILNSFTTNYTWILLGTMIPTTLFILLKRFAESKKDTKSTLWKIWIYVFVLMLFLLECMFILFVPLGYFTFLLTCQAIGIVEIVLSIIYGFTKSAKDLI